MSDIKRRISRLEAKINADDDVSIEIFVGFDDNRPDHHNTKRRLLKPGETVAIQVHIIDTEKGKS